MDGRRNNGHPAGEYFKPGGKQGPGRRGLDPSSQARRAWDQKFLNVATEKEFLEIRAELIAAAKDRESWAVSLYLEKMTGRLELKVDVTTIDGRVATFNDYEFEQTLVANCPDEATRRIMAMAVRKAIGDKIDGEDGN